MASSNILKKRSQNYLITSENLLHVVLDDHVRVVQLDGVVQVLANDLKKLYIDGCRAIVSINYILVTPVNRQMQSDGY